MVDASRDVAWDDFRLIREIAEARGLAGAADRLGVNHSTVFRRLGQIEAALGTPLFERHRTGYAVTPAGEEMARVAGRVEDEIAGFARRCVGREMSPSGELRVTASDSLVVNLLTPLLARFQTEYTDIRLDMVLTNLSLNLSKRDADVAIRATDQPPEALIGRRVARIAWSLYGRREDFPDPAAVRPEELYRRRWISLGDNMAGFRVVQFVRQHVAPERIVYRMSTVAGLGEAVAAGIGIGHLPCVVGDADPTLVRLEEPVPEFGADLWLLTHPDLRHSPRVRAFLDFLAAAIAPLRPLIEGAEPQPATGRGAPVPAALGPTTLIPFTSRRSQP